MSDQITDNGQTAPETTAEETWTARPEWEAALSVVPDGLRGNLYKQIRTSEAEAQKAVEAARQSSVEPAWRDFAAQAKEAGVDPTTLIESYNIRQQLLQDPQSFYTQLKTEIDAAVAAGQITRAEGAAATAQAQAQAADVGDQLRTPEQEELDQLKQQFNEMSALQKQQYQAAVEQQQEAQAKVYYDDFTNLTFNTFDQAGYGNANIETKIAVMRMADSALNGDTTGTLTEQQAISGAFQALLAFRDAQPGQVAAQAQQPGAMPVGGGRGMAAPEAQHFGTDLVGRKARIAAMIEEGQRQAAAGITSN